MTAEPAGLLGDAHGEVLRFCWVKHDEVTRLDTLARKLRSLNGNDSSRIQRSDLLSTLLLSGLDLAKTKEQTLVVFPGIGVRYEYPLQLKDAGRVKGFSRSHWPTAKTRPALSYVHGALVRLALQAAERDVSFITSDLAPRLVSQSALTGSRAGLVMHARKVQR